jgi:hypothetical protein
VCNCGEVDWRVGGRMSQKWLHELKAAEELSGIPVHSNWL